MTFKTNFDFAHASFEVVQASISLQHLTLHFSVCAVVHPTDNTILLTMFTDQLPDLCYINNLPGDVCLVGDMNIHVDNPLHSLLVKSSFWWLSGQCYSDFLLQCAGDVEADHTNSGIIMDCADQNHKTPHLGD